MPESDLVTEERGQKRSRRQVKRTAYHEAGHAVAFLVRRIPFKWVGIRPYPRDRWADVGEDGEELRGMVVTTGLGITYSELQHCWPDQLIMALAGHVAEARHAGLSRIFVCDGDHERIEACLTMSRLHAKARVRADYMDLTRLLVDRHWDAIEAVARALLERRCLAYREVRQIYRENPPQR